MTFRIHYTLADGSEDSFEVSGESMEQITKEALAGIQDRSGSDPWPEQIA